MIVTNTIALPPEPGVRLEWLETPDRTGLPALTGVEKLAWTRLQESAGAR